MEQRIFDEICIGLYAAQMFTTDLYNEMMEVATKYGLSTASLGG